MAINGNQKEITLQRFEASMGDFLDGLLYTNQDYCYYGPTEPCQAATRSISFLSTEFLRFPSPYSSLIAWAWRVRPNWCGHSSDIFLIELTGLFLSISARSKAAIFWHSLAGFGNHKKAVLTTPR